MKIPFKKDPSEFKQRALFATNVFDLLPSDHQCYVYEDIFEQLDTSSIEEQFSVHGQNAFHPRLITGILIYAYSQGVFSSRDIEKRCHEDLGFMFISHFNCPNFRVLSDFRKDNYEFFKECFKQSVLLAMEAGMASLGHVSLDGSKFKASTSLTPPESSNDCQIQLSRWYNVSNFFNSCEVMFQCGNKIVFIIRLSYKITIIVCMFEEFYCMVTRINPLNK